MLLKAYWA